jgi:hypothetical protein
LPLKHGAVTARTVHEIVPLHRSPLENQSLS